jgi:hypothetical protein
MTCSTPVEQGGAQVEQNHTLHHCSTTPPFGGWGGGWGGSAAGWWGGCIGGADELRSMTEILTNTLMTQRPHARHVKIL